MNKTQTMKFNRLFTDDRAVSPVIGVILMVAITVILAAVIGTFVLGIAPSEDAAPSAQISIEDAEDTSDTITIRNNGGDTVDLNEFTILVNHESDTVGGQGGLDTTLAPGEREEITLQGGALSADDEVTLRHNPSGSIIASTTASA